jgi:hypothetical protein
MSEASNNPDRYELGSGDGIHKTVMSSMTILELKEAIYPLNNKDAAGFLGISEAYFKKIISGDRPIPSEYFNGSIRRSHVMGFFRDSKSARKSRQQMRNKMSYRAFYQLMGNSFKKCSCCLYPAHEKIYGRYICEQCINRLKVKTQETSKGEDDVEMEMQRKEDLTGD